MPRFLITLLVLAAAVYLTDLLSFQFRFPNHRETLSTIDIRKSFAIPQKDGKIEFTQEQADTEVCAESLFPHDGHRPCWYVRRHTVQQIRE